MNCINTKSKDFKQLEGETGFSPIGLSIAISSWQSKNNTLDFPTSEQLTGISKEAVVLFSNNPKMLSVGTAKDYTAYTKEVENTSIEGFKDYMSDKVSLEETNTFNKDLNPNTLSSETKVNFNNLKGEVKYEPNHLGGVASAHAKMNTLIFNGKQPSEATITDVLESISNQMDEHLSEPVKDLINKAKRLKDVTDINLQVSDISTFPEDTIAYWDSASNTIHFAPDVMVNLPTDVIISTFLHEITHSKVANALLQPRTASEVQFQAEVSKLYGEFKDSSSSYGFQNEMEFVAELYANPTFVQEVRDLTEDSSLWSKLITAIRRLFNIKASKDFDTFLSDMIQQVETNNYDSILADNGIFKRSIADMPDFTTIDNKLSNIIKNIKDNIETTTKSVKNANSQVYDSGTKDILVGQLSEFADSFENLEHADSLRNIVSYTEFMLTNIRGMRLGINSRQLSHRDGISELSLLAYYEHLISDYEMMEDVSAFIASYEKKLTDQLRDGDTELYNEITPILNTISSQVVQIHGVVEDVRAKLHAHKQEIVVKNISTPTLITQVEAKYKEIYTRAYNNLTNPTTSKVEYVAQQMELNKDVMQREVEDVAHDIVYNPLKDISGAELQVSDYLNTNSKLFQIAVGMIMQYRDKRLAAFRNIENKLWKLFKDFKSEGNTSGSMATRYAKLYQVREDGSHYLTSKYTTELLDTYHNMLDKVNDEKYGGNKVFTISESEQKRLRKFSGNTILRNSLSDVAVNDVINLQVEDKTSRENATVKEVKVYDQSTFADDVESVIQKYTSFSTLAQLQKSKEYFNAESKGSKQNPELFKYLNNQESLTSVEFTKIDSEEINVTGTQAYRDWINETMDIVTEIDHLSHEPYSILTPKPKYVNSNFASLTTAEAAMLKEFTVITNKSEITYGGNNSIVSKIPFIENGHFYKLPTENKDNLERRGEGEFGNMIRDLNENLRINQADDIEIGEKITDLSGKQQLRIHNRGKIDPVNQSLDLPSLYRREAENALNHEARKSMEHELRAIADISARSKYIQKSKKTGDSLQDVDKTYQTNVFKPGTESNEYKKIIGLIETNLYDIHTHHGGKFGDFEINKITSLANGFAASVALTANVASGAANVINGLTQLHIDAMAGYHFSLKDLKSAELAYYQDMPNITADLLNPVKQSKINQIVQMFDFTGGISMAKQSFLKDSAFTKLASRESMNSLNEMGEHMMSSVLTMATLKGVKVMNANHQLINKEGAVVSNEKDAASLFDMLTLNKTTNELEVSPKFTYTTHTPTVAYNEGGKAQINMLIKKKSHDFYGAYDPSLQGEAQKKWYGKSLTMFKRFFIPGLQYRFRNYQNIKYHPDEVSDANRIYNASLKEFEEGYYVTLARTLYQVTKNLKSHGLAYAPRYYNSLSDYEKANLHKATIELVTRFVILPALALALLLAYDDDDKPYSILYQIVRLQSELGQFSNPVDLTKMMMNPVAGLTFVQNALKLVGDIATPINLNPTGKESNFDWLSEDTHGNNKLAKSIFRVVPIAAQTSKEWRNLYNIQK